MKLKCKHEPKLRLEFSSYSGNYTVELCLDCREAESNEFLVREEVIFT